jgi:hypothetical protein
MSVEHYSDIAKQLADVGRAQAQAIRENGLTGDAAAQMRTKTGRASHDAQLAHLSPAARAAYLNGRGETPQNVTSSAPPAPSPDA